MPGKILLLLSFFLLSRVHAAPPVIHAFVALCDNDHQGIQKVPAKIGNGDDPASNLYWGCDDGLAVVFSRSPDWKKLATLTQPVKDIVLERRIYQHTATKAWLVADAYRGREIKRCLADYFAALAGTSTLEVEVDGQKIAAAGASSLVAYLGHDGLMEFDLTPPAPAAGMAKKSAISLCCISQGWFGPKLEVLERKAWEQFFEPGQPICWRGALSRHVERYD